jgi:hypothetical protein
MSDVDVHPELVEMFTKQMKGTIGDIGLAAHDLDRDVQRHLSELSAETIHSYNEQQQVIMSSLGDMLSKLTTLNGNVTKVTEDTVALDRHLANTAFA